jgi:hypothetical protein
MWNWKLCCGYCYSFCTSSSDTSFCVGRFRWFCSYRTISNERLLSWFYGKSVRICDSRKCFWVKLLRLQVLLPQNKFLTVETSENNLRQVIKIRLSSVNTRWNSFPSPSHKHVWNVKQNQLRNRRVASMLWRVSIFLFNRFGSNEAYNLIKETL